MTRSRLALNLNTLGVGQRPAAWRSPDAGPAALVDLAHWENVARIAERGRLDAIFLADRPAITDPRSRPVQYLDPSVLVPAMAATTEQVGFVATASTTLNEVPEFARRLRSLHIATGGRFAWNAVTTWDPEAVRNFGFADLAPRADRYARAEEFVTAVLARAGFEGDDRPAILQAGGSEAGQRLAGRVADAVYAIAHDLDAASTQRARLRTLAAEAGRGEDAIRLFPGLALVIGSTEREARERFDHWEHQAPPTYSLNELTRAFGVDLSGADLDAPIPPSVIDDAEAADAGWSSGYRAALVARIRHDEPTIRELLRDFGGYGQRFLAATPEHIADTIEDWFRAGAIDGLNIMLDLFPSGLEDFVDQVVPLLQRRGIFRTEYAPGTLLERFRTP